MRSEVYDGHLPVSNSGSWPVVGLWAIPVTSPRSAHSSVSGYRMRSYVRFPKAHNRRRRRRHRQHRHTDRLYAWGARLRCISRIKEKKKFYPRRPYSWSPHHHTLSPALLVPRAPINQNLHFGCPYSLASRVFHLFSSHRKSHHVHQRTQIPHLHFYVINTRRTPRTVGRVERSFLERLLYCTVCDDAALSIHSLFDQCLQCNVCLILTLAVKKRVSCFFEAWFLAYWYYTPRTGYTSRSPGTVRSTSYAPHLIHVLYVKPSHARRAIPPGRRCAIVIVIVFPLWESTPVCYDEG